MPCNVTLSGALWQSLREELEDVLARHPAMYPGFEKGKRDFDAFDERHRTGEFVDSWGCVWENASPGVVGLVLGHPLESWDDFDEYEPPDPREFDHLSPIDWDGRLETLRGQKERGQLTQGGITHGFLYMRLTYLRGFENFLMDVASDDPRLPKLVSMVDDFNQYFVDQYLSVGVDVMNFAEDLGTQTSSVLSPEQFAKWMAPSYRRQMRAAREAGSQVFLHSDGHIMDIVDQLIDCGVTMINPQDLVNGIDNLAREVKGRVAIRLDVDRQSVVPFGTPREVHELIEEGVRKLGSPAGGLELSCGVYPPTPPENVDALIGAMEEFRTYWFDGRAT
jgi:uroporphyrinogen decarboxylase